ncbi:hypothetical protein RF11_01396 [Thelohanellus kitauei]|uniref:Uncharacterized protein n=1 Tax=Thelohanellus kitauei TaxID=669202 RepID=A0A0C2MWW8_THEKT|nr:hypothetical protein RF11_01396 [Thelohanellus kitauei]
MHFSPPPTPFPFSFDMRVLDENALYCTSMSYKRFIGSHASYSDFLRLFSLPYSVLTFLFESECSLKMYKNTSTATQIEYESRYKIPDSVFCVKTPIRSDLEKTKN